MADLDQLRDAITGEGDYARAPDSPIERDTICQGCGYNLRGIAESAVCPECGTPAAFSIKGDRLQYANPKWLGTVRRGLLIASASSLLYVPLSFVLGALAFLLPLPEWIQIGLTLAGPVVCSLAMGYGSFLMTAPEPRLHGDEAPLNWRRAVRAASVLAALVVPAYLAAMVLHAQGAWRISRETWSILGYTLLVVPAAIYGCLGHLRTLARRIPDPPLVTTTSIVLIGLPITSVLFILSPLRESDEAHFWLEVVPVTLFLIWTFALVWMYALALASPAQKAQLKARR
ncbi:MAG: hypothetical protein WD768_09150 [Phycisphaeraceae bacterium]